MSFAGDYIILKAHPIKGSVICHICVGYKFDHVKKWKTARFEAAFEGFNTILLQNRAKKI